MFVLPQIYSNADLALRIGLNIPAPLHGKLFGYQIWSAPYGAAWANQVRLIKRELRSKQSNWYDWMRITTAMNPVFTKGKIWNPRGWEGIGPFALDLRGRRPETSRSKQDIYVGRHDHQHLKGMQPNIFNRIFNGAEKIKIIENFENGGGKSLQQIHDRNNIYTEETPFPRFKTPTITNEKTLALYKKLFHGQLSLMNGQEGKNFYRPLPGSVRPASIDYIRRRNRLHDSRKNHWVTVDNPLTGWKISNKFDKNDEYQLMPFYIYDIRNDKYLLLPSSVRTTTENFTSAYAEDELKGRVDDVATYIKTSREYSIDMVLSAHDPLDYLIMWRKLGLLRSFQYPMYDQNGILVKPPIIRLRLGDMIRRGRQGHDGVAGFFRNFSITTDEATTVWQLENQELSMEQGIEILGTGPRLVEISWNFKVLHDSDYRENEDGTVDFSHDAVYKRGYHGTKLGSSFHEPARAYDNVIKPIENTDIDNANKVPEDEDAKGDMNYPALPPALAPMENY